MKFHPVTTEELIAFGIIFVLVLIISTIINKNRKKEKDEFNKEMDEIINNKNKRNKTEENEKE
jgi:hypothetical protein